jgi:hypothetical protein
MIYICIIILIIFFLLNQRILHDEHFDIINKTPIIKQTRDFAKNKIDKAKEYINKRPIYSPLPPEYTNTEYTGQSTMKGDIVHEQIVEEICPMGTFIKDLEIGTKSNNNEDYVGYIKGICSDGKILEILGKENKNIKNIKNIKEQYGTESLNIKYDDSYINKIGRVNAGSLENVGKKISCPQNNIIVGYRGRAEDKIKHLQFICNDKNTELDIPKTHIKCGDDGDVCKFNRNNEYIYYGVPDRKVVKINKKHIRGNSFTCYPIGFFPIKGAEILPIEDPIPGENKSCFIEKN